MKFFSAELAHNYDSYTFGYTNYCLREEDDLLSIIYQGGFLPYTGAKDTNGLFYMARSARIYLPHFESTSENRRIAKKFDGLFSRHEVGVKAIPQTHIRELFLDYFKKRHGNVMPEERFDYIVGSSLPLKVVTYQKGDRLIAAVLEIIDGPLGHFWFSAYSTEYDNTSLGLWLMLDCIRSAKTAGLEHYYLGTVYGEKALYKTNFSSLEWWDGERWSSDIALLKQRSRDDRARQLVSWISSNTDSGFSRQLY